MKPISDCRLYTFVDAAYLHGRDPAGLAEQLCQGGADVIQLRAKELSAEDIRRLTLELLPVTRQNGVNLIVNDHLSIAVETGADGCHLGQEDFFQAGHERIGDLKPVSRPFIIGLSTHAPNQARRSLAAGPDYIAIGPVYATGTKPAARPVTLEYVRWAAAHVAIPWFAIGGIQLKNLDEVLDAGAARICVVSAILNAPNVAEACQAFKERLGSAPLP